MGYLRGSNGGINTSTSYLRGSKQPPRRGSPTTLANKVKRLERKVAQLKPSIEDFRFTQQLTTATGVNTANIDITRDLIDASAFRDKILGDEWYNRELVFCIQATSAAITRLRCMVYIPTRAGTTVFVPVSGYEYVSTPDSIAFKVLSDTYHAAPFSASPLIAKVQVNLRSILTKYNSDGDNIDRNAFQVQLVWTSTATDPLRVGWSHMVSNK